MEIGIPEILLIVAGLVSFLVVHYYRKDKDAGSYKGAMVLGFLVGVATIVITATNYSHWAFLDSLLIIIAGFALVIRPFRDSDIAIVVAILGMAVTYVWLGQLAGGDFSILAETWPRVILTVVVGAIVYMILNFVQKIAQLFGKLLNFWPILFLLGLVCIVEGVLIMAGGKTLFEYIEEYRAAGSAIIAMVL